MSAVDGPMTVASRMTRVVRTELVRLNNGPVVPQQFSTQGRTFVVERVEVKFTLTDDGWEPSTPHISGSVLKKGGERGRQEARQPVWKHDGWPDWLTALVDDLRANESTP